MANVNTIASAGGITQGNVLVETAFASAIGGATRLAVAVPSNPPYTGQAGRKIIIRALATVTGGTTTNYTFALRANLGGNTNLTTFTNDTALCTTAATAVNSATRTMMLESFIYWDATSQRAPGAFCIMTDVVGGVPTYTGYAVNTNPLASVAAITNLSFIATGIFSATNAGNTAFLNELSVEVV